MPFNLLTEGDVNNPHAVHHDLGSHRDSQEFVRRHHCIQLASLSPYNNESAEVAAVRLQEACLEIFQVALLSLTTQERQQFPKDPSGLLLPSTSRKPERNKASKIGHFYHLRYAVGA